MDFYPCYSTVLTPSSPSRSDFSVYLVTFSLILPAHSDVQVSLYFSASYRLHLQPLIFGVGRWGLYQVISQQGRDEKMEHQASLILYKACKLLASWCVVSIGRLCLLLSAACWVAQALLLPPSLPGAPYRITSSGTQVTHIKNFTQSWHVKCFPDCHNYPMGEVFLLSHFTVDEPEPERN